jgi:hypothetical protein
MLGGVAHGAEISGRLLDGSNPDGFVTGHEVRLTAQLASGERVDRTVTTDAAGAYAFAQLPGDTADVYVLSTLYEGVDYVSGFLRFPPSAATFDADLLVYESTSDASLLRLNARHLVVEIAPDADHVLVTEVLAFGNPGQKTIVPEEPVTLAIPDAATHVEGVEGFDHAHVEGAVMSLTLNGAVRPGTFRFEGAIRYHLPTRFPLSLDVRETIPTDEATVLVSPVGSRVTADGLESLGQIDLGDGVVCDRYRLPVQAGAGAVTVLIDPVRRAAARDPRTPLIVGGVLALFGGLLLARERARSGGEARPARELERLVGDRSRYLSEIVALDARAADEPEARAEREKLLVKATALQELIDELTERRA